jgi:hypothetical protein
LIRRAGTLAGVVVALAVPALAHAHEGNPNYESRVTSVAPRVAGLELRVLNYDDRLELVNHSGRTVVIEGYDGEPYARLAPDGLVQVNDRSPARWLNDDRFAAVNVPASADPKAAPKWRTIDRAGRFDWHDHRIHWMSRTVPPVVKDREQRTKVFDWRVPLRVGGEAGAVSGTLTWKPTPGSGGPPTVALVALGLIAAGGLGAVVVVLRRRRRARPASPSKPVAEEREAW